MECFITFLQMCHVSLIELIEVMELYKKNIFSGHGQSDGHRFHVDRFDTYVTDAIELMKEHRREVGEEKPFIMFGHSMGGLLATHCMLQVPELFTACILSSPCLKVGYKVIK